MKITLVAIWCLFSINSIASKSNFGAPEFTVDAQNRAQTAYFEVTGNEKFKVLRSLKIAIEETDFVDCEVKGDNLHKTGYTSWNEYATSVNRGLPMINTFYGNRDNLRVYRNVIGQPLLVVNWTWGYSGIQSVTIQTDASKTSVRLVSFTSGLNSLVNSGSTLHLPVTASSMTDVDTMVCSAR